MDDDLSKRDTPNTLHPGIVATLKMMAASKKCALTDELLERALQTDWPSYLQSLGGSKGAEAMNWHVHDEGLRVVLLAMMETVIGSRLFALGGEDCSPEQISEGADTAFSWRS